MEAAAMKRYSIIVREYGSDHDVELMQLDSNPGEVVKGLQKKTLMIKKSIFEGGKRKSKIAKYSYIHVRENE